MSTEIPAHLLRIIDANTNRIAEGLRFLEEITRMVLNDTPLTQQLKDLRHRLVESDLSLQKSLLHSRESDSDVGAEMLAEGAQEHKQLGEAVVANSRRVQESLRVLEEMARVTATPLPTETYKQARFSVYTIEKAIVSKLLRRDKLARLPGLYVVIDMPSLQGRSPTEVAGEAIRGGATTIQLRDKRGNKRELLPVARELKALCAGHNVLFIVNDYLDLALAADADGLHVGTDDLPVKEARRLLPIDKLLGASVFTTAQALAAQADGADYVATQAIFPTGSKDAVEVVGVDVLRQVKDSVSMPVVAIGGINRDNVDEVLAAGADSIAVISAILGAKDVAEASRQLAERFKK